MGVFGLGTEIKRYYWSETGTNVIADTSLCQCGPQRKRQKTLTKRQLLSLTLPLILVQPVIATEIDKAEQKNGQVLKVGPRSEYKAITAALQDAKEHAVIVVAPGLYKERLLLAKPVTIQAEKVGTSTIVWETSQPYESVVQCTASSCRIVGLNIDHASPSVANNCAIVNQGGALSIEACNVTSKTGNGIACEGGLLCIENSRVHDCAGQGIAIYADLEGLSSKALIQRCQISNNMLNGLIIKEESQLVLEASEITGNKGYGLLVKDSSVKYSSDRKDMSATLLKGNMKGNVHYGN